MARGFLVWRKALLVEFRKLGALNLVLCSLVLNILKTSAHIVEFKVRTCVGTCVLRVVFIFKVDSFVVKQLFLAGGLLLLTYRL